MRRSTIVATVVLAQAFVARPLLAACEDWHPVVRVLSKTGTAWLGEGGELRGIMFTLTLTSPVTYISGVFYRLGDVAKRIEVADVDRRPIDLGPAAKWPTVAALIHEPTWTPTFFPGKPTTLAIEPYWLWLPRGGTYWIRKGFDFPDITRPRGTPRCEVYSDWTLVEFHPVVRLPTSLRSVGHGLFPRTRNNGVLWPTEEGKLYWTFLNTSTGKLVNVLVGSTSEKWRAPIDRATESGFKEIDARVDRDGVTHIVFPEDREGGLKTTYVKVGPDGATLGRVVHSGRKGLGGPRDGILLVDKVPKPAWPTR